MAVSDGPETGMLAGLPPLGLSLDEREVQHDILGSLMRRIVAARFCLYALSSVERGVSCEVGWWAMRTRLMRHGQL
jgi:hypothetical protein